MSALSVAKISLAALATVNALQAANANKARNAAAKIFTTNFPHRGYGRSNSDGAGSGSSSSTIKSTPPPPAPLKPRQPLKADVHASASRGEKNLLRQNTMGKLQRRATRASAFEGISKEQKDRLFQQQMSDLVRQSENLKADMKRYLSTNPYGTLDDFTSKVDPAAGSLCRQLGDVADDLFFEAQVESNIKPKVLPSIEVSNSTTQYMKDQMLEKLRKNRHMTLQQFKDNHFVLSRISPGDLWTCWVDVQKVLLKENVIKFLKQHRSATPRDFEDGSFGFLAEIARVNGDFLEEVFAEAQEDLGIRNFRERQQLRERLSRKGFSPDVIKPIILEALVNNPELTLAEFQAQHPDMQTLSQQFGADMLEDVFREVQRTLNIDYMVRGLEQTIARNAKAGAIRDVTGRNVDISG